MSHNAGIAPMMPMAGAPYGMYPGAYAGQGCYGAPPACGGPGAYGGYAQQTGGYPPGPGGPPPPGPPGGGKSPGTIRMRGLPFRSTVDDVFRFFQGLQIPPGGIVLGQRDGRATGEAWVTFASPAEAQRAMQKNNTHMGSRYIELFAT